MSILDEIAEYMEQSHRYENYVSALCPFHDDSRPSLLIYDNNYFCASCGAYGKTSYLLSTVSKLPVRHTQEARPFYNPFSSWIKKYTRLGLALKTANQILQQKPSKYLQMRGIPHSEQIKLSLGYLDDWYTIPIRNNENKIVGAVARKSETNRSNSKYIIPFKQNPNLLYVPSWRLLENSNFLILTFGIFDAISLYLCGMPSASTTTGKRLSPSALDQFRKRIFIWSDLKEESDAHKLAANLGWRGSVISCKWPINTKDISDLFCTNKEKLSSIIAELGVH
jgi:DNA primase